MSKSVSILLLLSSFQLIRVATLSLSVSPDHVQISEDPQSVFFSCSADTALTGCQYRWWDDWGKTGPLLELSRGSESRANSTHLDIGLTGYSYSGRGLEAGDCGVSLQLEGGKLWMVACRVRANTGGWTYAWADLTASPYEHLPNTRTPRESVGLLGGKARFTLKAQEPLQKCNFFVPGLTLYFEQGAQSGSSTGRHRYLGGGLGGGECGLELSNVSEADNGPIRSFIENTAGTKVDMRLTALIVARPPGAPTLRVVYTNAGVTATCEVQKSRPVANITWILGDEVVRQDSLNDHPGNDQDEWRWPWMQGSILQRISLIRQTKDNGKVLKCVVFHVALTWPLEAMEMISFTEPLSTTAQATVQTTTTAPSSNVSPGIVPDATSTATSTLSLLCQEYRLIGSHLGNTSCPGDDVYEYRVREARAAARTAELAEEEARVTLYVAKADSETKAVLAKVALEQAKASAKADAETQAVLAKVALEQAKASAKADAETQAVLAKVALEQAKASAKADAETQAMLAKAALEQAKASAKADSETKAVLAKVALEAEVARARREEARAKNAEEELRFERERRSLQHPRNSYNVQSWGQK